MGHFWGSQGPLGPRLGHLGALLGLFGGSWSPLGALLGHLGALFGLFGESWGPLGTLLGHLGALLELFGGSWGHLGALLERLGALLGPSWGYLRGLLGALGVFEAFPGRPKLPCARSLVFERSLGVSRRPRAITRRFEAFSGHLEGPLGAFLARSRGSRWARSGRAGSRRGATIRRKLVTPSRW